MEEKKIISDINLFEKDVIRYEQDLRTRFIGEIWNIHLQCQFVDNETIRIKNKVRDLMSLRWNTSENFRINELITRVSGLIRKYETLRDKWIDLNWDILYLYWQMSTILAKKHIINN